jgi:hypothetical protein
MLFRELIKYMLQFFVEPVFYFIDFIFCRGVNIENDDMTPATS